ncbi:NAD(P)-dependent oxidoreductase [Streptomyces mirabilis]|uniref:NAD(P)-dependent oxidoreductase n=1 Tax=Streptomyces mirabilis TaxID=68239 RepID=UPI0033B531ED
MTSSTQDTPRPYPDPSAPSAPPAPVTVLGLGPMGRALASAFLAAGHPVTVWNRTPGRAGDLPDRGAAVAGSVADAVGAGRVVVACLRDYDAVRAVLEPVAPTRWEGRLLTNLTSGEPARARSMADWATAHGIRYLDGAILAPTQVVGTAATAVLYSGAHEVHEAVRDTMAAVGGTGTYLGADPGRAAAYEVALLDLFTTSVYGVAHSFALASAEGIAPDDLAPFAIGISGLLSEMIPRFAGQLRTGDYPGERSTIASAATTIAHLIDAATAHGLEVGALTAAKGAADRAVAAGHGPDGLPRLATVLRAGKPAG